MHEYVYALKSSKFQKPQLSNPRGTLLTQKDGKRGRAKGKYLL